MDLDKLINEIKVLNEIPNLNRGGCGYSAIAIYRYIKQNYRYKSIKLVVLNDYESDHDNTIRFVDTKGRLGELYASHIVVKLNNSIHIDSKGLYSVNRHNYGIELNKSEHKILYLALKRFQWNPDFDRRNVNKVLSLTNPLQLTLF